MPFGGRRSGLRAQCGLTDLGLIPDWLRNKLGKDFFNTVTYAQVRARPQWNRYRSSGTFGYCT